MPVDKDGNRADVVVYAKSAVSRLNPGQFYEQYINAASRDMSKWVCNEIDKLSHEFIWHRVMAYYAVAAPKQHNMMVTHYTDIGDQIEHIQSIVDDGIYLFISPDEPHLNSGLRDRIESVISPTYGPVTYIDSTGKTVTTKANVLIGSKTMIVLEKTDQNPMAVSSGSLQHHGLPSGPSKISRLSHPSKVQSTRVLGETECRLFAGTISGEAVADLLDMSGSPDTHREVLKNILTADEPMNMDAVIDRTEHPLGGARGLNFVNHVLNCMGVEIIDE